MKTIGSEMRSRFLLIAFALFSIRHVCSFLSPDLKGMQLRVVFAKPQDASDDEWALVVDAETSSRSKRYGPLADIVVSRSDIEANQLRIWESVQKKRTAASSANNRSAR